MNSKDKKNCFITGANSGIGKQAAIQLAEAGLHVILGTRNRKRGEAALTEVKKVSGSSDVELLEIDMSSKESIFGASELLHNQLEKLDVLIHNAADFDIARKQPEKTVDGIETIWATNHIGPITLTNALLDLIQNSKQGRIITIASQGLVMHPKLKVDLVDPEFEHKKYSVPKAYYQSKLAQLMYTYWLAAQLNNTTITVNCIRVTNVKVDLNRYPDISGFKKWLYSIKSRFSISAEEMARTYTWLATSPDLNTITGKYFDEKNKIVNSSAYSMNKRNIEAMIDLSMSYKPFKSNSK